MIELDNLEGALTPTSTVSTAASTTFEGGTLHFARVPYNP